MMNHRRTILSLLVALTVLGLGAGVPAQADSRVNVGRIAQQRAGAMDRREPTRAPQVQRVDNRRGAQRAEVQKAPPQRAGKADKRR